MFEQKKRWFHTFRGEEGQGITLTLNFSFRVKLDKELHLEQSGEKEAVKEEILNDWNSIRVEEKINRKESEFQDQFIWELENRNKIIKRREINLVDDVQNPSLEQKHKQNEESLSRMSSGMHTSSLMELDKRASQRRNEQSYMKQPEQFSQKNVHPPIKWDSLRHINENPNSML